MTLGDIIYNYRTEHKMSMDAFADRSGMSKAYIYQRVSAGCYQKLVYHRTPKF